MRNILFLTSVMKKGHGVSVVIHALKQELAMQGYSVFVGSQNIDQSDFSDNTFSVESNLTSVTKLAQELKIDVIIAVTSPFFEHLPALGQKYKVIAYEHGDPTPELFTYDSEVRKEISLNKQKNVYKFVDSVIVISDFIRSDIKFKDSILIYNGINHVPDVGEKEPEFFLESPSRSIRIGTLMRIGAGEAHYKGNDLFLKIVDKLKELGEFEFSVMGKGSEGDAKSFSSNGIKVFLNSTDSERNNYLRDLDIFISPSLWEGFNLPLVEAQALGTLALAFDTGAHPEVTPYIYGSIDEMTQNICVWNNDRIQLQLDSSRCYKFVRNKFNWKTSATEFSQVIENLFLANSNKESLSNSKKFLKGNASPWLKKSTIRRAFKFLIKNGFRVTAIKIIRRVARNMKIG